MFTSCKSSSTSTDPRTLRISKVTNAARPCLILAGMVHPCGSGAFGHFEVTKDISDLTKADFLSTVGEKTPVFVLFSTVTLGREFPDEARNPRGFAIKFYTKE